MFSAPLDLLAFARGKHLRAVEYNDTSLQQLEDVINRGIPTDVIEIGQPTIYDANSNAYTGHRRDQALK